VPPADAVRTRHPQPVEHLETRRREDEVLRTTSRNVSSCHSTRSAEATSAPDSHQLAVTTADAARTGTRSADDHHEERQEENAAPVSLRRRGGSLTPSVEEISWVVSGLISRVFRERKRTIPQVADYATFSAPGAPLRTDRMEPGREDRSGR